MVKVTIGIKALNEEANIAASVESALAALSGIDGEVILADCGSNDTTVAVARRYPVRIVQLLRAEDRGCGAGAQLAFQYARGDYFYLLDGDMTLDPDFVAAGLAHLEANPDIGGVGGYVTERNLSGEEFQVRADKAKNFEAKNFERDVSMLDCGGLYRTAAIRSSGYFADRNLHAFEEFDLGARLAANGYRLVRLDRPGVNHYGHAVGGYRLLWRRLRSGYSDGLGEALRAALAGPHLTVVLKWLRTLQMSFVVLLWWLALAACLITGQFLVLLALIAVPLAYLVARRRSLRLGLYSFVTCNVLTIGLVGGLFRRRISPLEPLAAADVTSSAPGNSSEPC